MKTLVLGSIEHLILQNLADSHRCFYLPYSDDANMVAELPNQAGLFFTTQRVSRRILDTSFQTWSLFTRSLEATSLSVMIERCTSFGWWSSTRSTVQRANLQTRGEARRSFGDVSLNTRCSSSFKNQRNVNVHTQAYNDRVLELLTRLGNHVKILFRCSRLVPADNHQ